MTGEAREAIVALDFFLGYAGGWMPVDHFRPGLEGENWHRTGDAGSGRRLAETVAVCDERWSHEVSFGLPCRKRRGGVTRGTVLWVRIEGGDQLKKARAFRPYPTVVLQEGQSSRRLLLWALERPVDYFELVTMNKRLAYRFGAVQKHADPDALRVPAPGTFLRAGRSRPAPVVVGRLEADTYTSVQVAGKLKDPPEITWERGQMFIDGKPVAA